MTTDRSVAVQVGRPEVLAYRAAAQQLIEPAPRPDDVAVLGIGVQDTPRGSARLALRARTTAVGQPHDLAGLQTAMLTRGAPHVVRGRELALLTTALRPLDDDDAARADEIAAAMRDVVGGSAGVSRPDLSEALNGLVRDELRTWCERCGSRHVPEGLFRIATARAGLVLAADESPVRFVPDDRAASARTGPADEQAQAELVRRFVHLLGPTRPAHLAAWRPERRGPRARRPASDLAGDRQSGRAGHRRRGRRNLAAATAPGHAAGHRHPVPAAGGDGPGRPRRRGGGRRRRPGRRRRRARPRACGQSRVTVASIRP